MPNIGFATGAIALNDFDRALDILTQTSANAVELSAIREYELLQLVQAFERLELSRFDHVSLHAPKFDPKNEVKTLHLLEKFLDHDISIVIHPDVIQDMSAWSQLGPLLIVENMDIRKPIGQTVDDLEKIFEELPNASFCLDVGHAWQTDSSLSQARLMLERFGDRLKEYHISCVDVNSRHQRLTLEAVTAFQQLNLPQEVVTIIESPCTELEQVIDELQQCRMIFDCK